MELKIQCKDLRVDMTQLKRIGKIDLGENFAEITQNVEQRNRGQKISNRMVSYGSIALSDITAGYNHLGKHIDII